MNVNVTESYTAGAVSFLFLEINSMLIGNLTVAISEIISCRSKLDQNSDFSIFGLYFFVSFSRLQTFLPSLLIKHCQVTGRCSSRT